MAALCGEAILGAGGGGAAEQSEGPPPQASLGRHFTVRLDETDVRSSN